MTKVIALDANILIRAILGKRVPLLLSRYGNQVSFFTAAICYEEVRTHLPTILQKRDLPVAPFMEAIGVLAKVVSPIGEDIYTKYEAEAKRRVQKTDINDWPLIALALSLNCPIWTEDRDFFGTGVATWQTHNIEIYLDG